MQLRNIFAREPHYSEQRRYFLVEDKNLRERILDIIEREVVAFQPILAGAFITRAFSPLSSEFLNTTLMDAAIKNYIAHSVDSKKDLNILLGLPHWPSMLRAKGQSALIGEPGIEAGIVKGALYITAPRLSYIEGAYEAGDAAVQLKTWQPPAGMREVPSPLRWEHALFPAVSPSLGLVQDCRVAKNAGQRERIPL